MEAVEREVAQQVEQDEQPRLRNVPLCPTAVRACVRARPQNSNELGCTGDPIVAGTRSRATGSYGRCHATMGDAMPLTCWRWCAQYPMLDSGHHTQHMHTHVRAGRAHHALPACLNAHTIEFITSLKCSGAIMKNACVACSHVSTRRMCDHATTATTGVCFRCESRVLPSPHPPAGSAPTQAST